MKERLLKKGWSDPVRDRPVSLSSSVSQSPTTYTWDVSGDECTTRVRVVRRSRSSTVFLGGNLYRPLGGCVTLTRGPRDRPFTDGDSSRARGTTPLLSRSVFQTVPVSPVLRHGDPQGTRISSRTPSRLECAETTTLIFLATSSIFPPSPLDPPSLSRHL